MAIHNVLMFGWEFPPFNSGGLGVACFGLTKALSNKGANITFVLPRRYDLKSPNLHFVFAGNPRVRVKEVDSLLRPYISSDHYDHERAHYKTALYSNTLVGEVLRYGIESQPIARSTPHTIIHAHDWLSFPAGIEAQKMSHRPLIAHIHATEFDRTGGKGVNKQVYEIEKKGMQYAQKIIAVSKLTKKTIMDQYGIKSDKIEVVYNGINLQDYHHSHINKNLLKLKEFGYKVVLFTGRITLQKGPDYFVHTAKKVLQYYDRVIFVIAGAGDMERQIIQLGIKIGISDRLFFTGYLRGDELNNMYKSADILVMPSVSEPFGITALESIANNTPVLISKQSGVSEVLCHALKVDFWDIDEMANKIVGILRHTSLRNTLNYYSKHEISQLTWDRAASKCLSVYNNLSCH